MNLGLQCLGISHHTASVELRERLAFDAHRREEFLARLRANGEHIEAAILSTCNRTEVYIAEATDAKVNLVGLLANTFEFSQAELEPVLYAYQEEQVVSHLFRVAAGLDSMVLGESQVLGQITEAYGHALADGSAGPILSRLFQAAIRAGKRVRTETGIGRLAVSVPSLAAQLAQQHIGQLEAASVTLLGAGEMAELAMDAFRKRGVSRFTVVSRTLATASKLAERWQGEAGTMDTLSDALAQSDILLASSSAPHTLIDRALIDEVMRSRMERPLVVIDIAVPRDVAPEVRSVPNVTLFDIDDLRATSRVNRNARESEIPLAERILEEEYRASIVDLTALKATPVIRELRQHVENIRASEVEKTLRRLGELNPEQVQHIEALTHSIVQKMLHTPTLRLRQEAGRLENGALEAVVRELFALSPSSGSGMENGQ